MKKLLLAFCLFSVSSTIAQNNAESIYILVRHAEKDTSQAGSTMMQADPSLTKQGLLRAEKLITVLKKYNIDSIYSTNFIRTISTASPIAKKIGLEINKYDHKKLQDFANQMLSSSGKTILVIGHSNTTPSLTNLLLKEKKYEALDESVYNKIFIVTIKNGKASAEVIEY